MGTVIRAEISKNNKYYISKHRYYELKHFCLQYDEWKRELNRLNWFGEKGDGRSTDPAKPVEWMVQRRDEYLKKMEMIEQAALEADSDIYSYIVKGVTQGVTYSHLRADGLLCSKDYYYAQYRHFFWCLDHLRG